MANIKLLQTQQEYFTINPEGYKLYPNYIYPLNSEINQSQVEYLTNIVSGYKMYPNFRYPFISPIKQIQLEADIVKFHYSRIIQNNT